MRFPARIEANPNVLMGKPVFRGTRISVYLRIRRCARRRRNCSHRSVKLLLDENLSPLHARTLRSLGHDTVSTGSSPSDSSRDCDRAGTAPATLEARLLYVSESSLTPHGFAWTSCS